MALALALLWQALGRVWRSPASSARHAPPSRAMEHDRAIEVYGDCRGARGPRGEPRARCRFALGGLRGSARGPEGLGALRGLRGAGAGRQGLPGSLGSLVASKECNISSAGKGARGNPFCESQRRFLIVPLVSDIIRTIRDPEKPNTLEELEVVTENCVEVQEIGEDEYLVIIRFTPTVPHCSLATLIGEIP